MRRILRGKNLFGVCSLAFGVKFSNRNEILSCIQQLVSSENQNENEENNRT
jgi:hypothetical protein